MTAPDRDKQSGLRDEVLAGEYVLGALPPESMAELTKRVKRDRQFAAMVRRWRENLAETEYREKATMAVLLERDPARPGLPFRSQPLRGGSVFAGMFSEVWNSVRFWRLLALTAMLWTAVLLFTIA
jgi:anti-sigma-K factor RskA